MATTTRSTAQSITFRELLDYTAGETERWHRWLERQPADVLDIRLGEGRIATIRDLVQHIFAVERRYADRLQGREVSGYDVIDPKSVESLFAGGREARARLEQYLAGATDADLGRRLEFQTLSAGPLAASARKIVAHTLLHGVRHWAQLATYLRQQGHPTDWAHDLLLSDAMA